MQVILILYGLFLFFGAYKGWKAGSNISLVMGLVSGLLIMGAWYIAGFHPTKGYWCSSVVSGFLTVTFLIRVIKTQTFIPAGMLLTISLLVFVASLLSALSIITI